MSRKNTPRKNTPNKKTETMSMDTGTTSIEAYDNSTMTANSTGNDPNVADPESVRDDDDDDDDDDDESGDETGEDEGDDEDEEEEDTGADNTGDAVVPDSARRTISTDVVDNVTAVSNMMKAFELSSKKASEPQAHISKYKDNVVSAEQFKVLEHVVDNFNDHIGSGNVPNFRFVLENCTNLGDNPEYKARDDGPGNRFLWKVNCVYNIKNETVKADIFAIDNLLFEMYPALDKSGNVANNHGVSWMNVYFTKDLAGEFVSKFQSDINWPIKPSTFIPDDKQGLLSCQVKMDAESLPWTVMVPVKNKVKLRKLPFKDVFTDPTLNKIYVGTGIFTMNYSNVMEHESPDRVQSYYKDTKLQDRPQGKPNLTLIGVRIFKVSQSYKKIDLRKKPINV